jgi:hypothetical protein
MTMHQRHPDAVRLDRIRDRLALLGDVRLTLGDGQDGGRPIMALWLDDGRGPRLLLHTLADDPLGADLIGVLASALDDLGFLIGLVDRAADRVRALAAAKAAPLSVEDLQSRNLARQAAIACQQDRALQALLAREVPVIEGRDLDALPPGDAAAERLRAALNIASRATLNTDPDAARRWLRLRDRVDHETRQGGRDG